MSKIVSVRMRSVYASPLHGNASAGDVISLPEAEARALLSGNYAEAYHETAALVPGSETRGRAGRGRGGRRAAAPAVTVIDSDGPETDDEDADDEDEDEE